MIIGSSSVVIKQYRYSSIARMGKKTNPANPVLNVCSSYPSRQEVADEAGETHVQHTFHQHRCPPRMCALPTALLPVHWRLNLRGPHCGTPEVCRWHSCHWSHQRCGWVCTQTGAESDGFLVQPQQPGAEHTPDSGEDSGLQEESNFPGGGVVVSTGSTFLCGVWMFSLCLCGFS